MSEASLTNTVAMSHPRLDDDCVENALLVTNITTTRMTLHTLEAEYERVPAMREAIRLYGNYFGLEMKDTAYDRFGRLIAGRTSIHYTERSKDLSLFWRLYEAIATECAKA